MQEWGAMAAAGGRSCEEHMEERGIEAGGGKEQQGAARLVSTRLNAVQTSLSQISFNGFQSVSRAMKEGHLHETKQKGGALVKQKGRAAMCVTSIVHVRSWCVRSVEGSPYKATA